LGPGPSGIGPLAVIPGNFGLSTLSVGNSRIDACYVCKIVMQHDARRQNIYIYININIHVCIPKQQDATTKQIEI
jgi:hypothetical protein